MGHLSGVSKTWIGSIIAMLVGLCPWPSLPALLGLSTIEMLMPPRLLV